MDRELERYLVGITAVLCLIAGVVTAGFHTTDFGYFLFSGVSVGTLLFVGVYGYQTNTPSRNQ